MGRRRKQPHELVPSDHEGQARVWYGGWWHYLGPWDAAKGAPSVEAAAHLDRLRAVWRADPGARTVAGQPDGLLAVLWADWRESPAAKGRHVEAAGRAAVYLFGTADAPGPYRYARVTEFGGVEYRAVQQALCDSGLSRSCVEAAVWAIYRCLDWGLSGRRVGYEQVREVESVELPPRGAVKEPVKRKGVLWERVEPVLGHLTPPLAAVVRLLWHTCARPKELLTLRAGDVRRGGQVLAASGITLDLDAMGVWAAVKEEHKTDAGGYDRVIFFGPKARAVIGPLLAGLDDATPIFRPAAGRAHATALKKAKRKAGNYGTYKPRKGEGAKRKPRALYDSHALNVAVRRACGRAEVAVWTPYQVRHAAFKLVQKEFGRDAARVFGGHKVGGATERYAGADLAAAARVAREWG